MGDPTALLKAPRVVRLEAAQWLETLVEALAAQAESYAKNIEEAEKIAKDGDVGDTPNMPCTYPWDRSRQTLQARPSAFAA
jgi:hypothetical protein